MYARVFTVVLLLAGLLIWMALEGSDPVAPAALGWRAATDGHPFLGPETRLSGTGNLEAERYLPAVAYNDRHREFLVAWQNTFADGRRDIYARRVTPQGRLRGWLTVTTGTTSRFTPALAYNSANDEYLVVWMLDTRGDGTKYEIWGRVIAWDGRYLKPEFKILSFPQRSFWAPRVAWNSRRNEFLVVSGALDTSAGQPGVPAYIAGVRLADNGGIIANEPLATSGAPSRPDVVYNAASDEYFVAFVRSDNRAAGGNDIYGLRVTWQNDVLDPPGAIPIDDGPGDQDQPSVATNGQERYIAVWQSHLPTGQRRLAARELSALGQPGQIYALPGEADQTVPDVAAAPGPGGNYLAVWQQPAETGQALFATYFGPHTLAHAFQIAPGAPGEYAAPVAAAGGPGFFVAYEGAATAGLVAHVHIYGRGWFPYGAFLPLQMRPAPSPASPLGASGPELPGALK